MFWVCRLADGGLEQVFRRVACGVCGEILGESDEFQSALLEGAFELDPGLGLVCAGGSGEEVEEECGEDEEREGGWLVAGGGLAGSTSTSAVHRSC